MDVMRNVTNNMDWDAVVGVGEQVVLTCVGVLVSVVGAAGNWVVIALVARALPLRSSVNLLLACLALCDGLSTSLLLPLDVLSLLGQGKLLPASVCHAHAFLCSVMEIEAVAVLAAACVDRCLLLVRRRAPLGPLAARLVLAATWTASVALALPPHLGLGGRLYPPLPAGLTRCLWVPASSPSFAQLVYVFVRCSMSLLLSALLVTTLATLTWWRSNVTIIQCGRLCVDGGHNRVMKCRSRRLRTGCGTVGEDLRPKNKTLTALGVLCLLTLLGRTPPLLACLAHSLRDGVGWEWFPWLAWWSYLPSAASPIVYTFRIKHLRDELRDVCPWVLRVMGTRRGGFLGARKAAYMLSQPFFKPPLSSIEQTSSTIPLHNIVFPQRHHLSLSRLPAMKKNLIFEASLLPSHPPALRVWSCKVGCEKSSASPQVPKQRASL